MSVARQPAGTSIGGQWAPGSAGEVEDSLDADFLVPDHGVVDDLLDERNDSEALGIITGVRHDASGADLSESKAQIHGYLDHTSSGPGRDEANAALTKLYAAEHSNPTVGIGRLVGDNRACRAAESELRVQQNASRAQNILAVSTSRLGDSYPDMSGLIIDDEEGSPTVTGEYVGADGEMSGFLNSDDLGDVRRAYDVDAGGNLRPQRSTSHLYTHRSAQTYVLDVEQSSAAFTSVDSFRHQDAEAVGDEAVAARAFAIRNEGGGRRTALYVDTDRPNFVQEKRMRP